VRAAVGTMWAEQQLASARLAVEAQTEIDREQQRRRVVEALGGPVQAQAERIPEPEPTPLPAAPDTPENLPALPESSDERRQQGASLIPTIPDVTKAAARWIRPFVPPIIASAIDTTTKPLRQVFEETEEIHFSLKRTHKVSVHSEQSGEQQPAVHDTADGPGWIESVRPDERGHDETAGPGQLRGADGPRQLPPGD
jgi:hypothetical protein